MRRIVAYPLAGLAAVGSTLFVASPASAHGYVSSPPSRQALCATGTVSGCGPIQYEPQSVEGPKGLRSCDGGNQQFSALSDESRNWPATAVGSSVTFNWVITARHRTADWRYYVGDKLVGSFAGNNELPGSVVNHKVDLSGLSGRRTVLAVWNIGDTANAFYSCVDVNIGGGSGTAPPTTAPPTTAPTEEPEPTDGPTAEPSAEPTAGPPTGPAPQPEPSAGGDAWKVGRSYKAGDVVTYGGEKYRCRQAHRSIRSWEPSQFTLALWLPL
ncbi:lytic polysaccharide monooxygenase [Actinomadura sp. WMMB 499]|uniref:lytic polysaccharide monooxygenase n=1 Tax=Actinomadura sp. WMMB 499 TaxID=1219491 RepID=UPI001243ED18|nr:lytic polysaccharide monooxygenase [Actinomadura sp. WMMB 499]QFG21832.1 cellulose-binding protein [Actinomadura sp. WMMB 499]